MPRRQDDYLYPDGRRWRAATRYRVCAHPRLPGYYRVEYQKPECSEWHFEPYRFSTFSGAACYARARGWTE